MIPPTEKPVAAAPAPSPPVEAASHSSATIADVLAEKIAFVKAKVAEGHTPTPPQLASFLSKLRDDLGPLMRGAPADTSEGLSQAFASVGWDVKLNKSMLPMPPSVNQVSFASICDHIPAFSN